MGVNRYLEVLASEKGVQTITVTGSGGSPKSIEALGQRLRDLDLAIDNLTPSGEGWVDLSGQCFESGGE